MFRKILKLVKSHIPSSNSKPRASSSLINKFETDFLKEFHENDLFSSLRKLFDEYVAKEARERISLFRTINRCVNIISQVIGLIVFIILLFVLL